MVDLNLNKNKVVQLLLKNHINFSFLNSVICRNYFGMYTVHKY